MIITNVLGGLGNQMFQYAAARALSLAKDQPLYLDVADFATYPLHQFELMRVFDFKAELADAGQLREMLGWRANKGLLRVLRRVPLDGLRGSHLVIEPHFHFWPGFFEVGPDSYLMGYWQSEKYFQNFVDTIRHDFTFTKPLVGTNLELAKQIAACQAVSLHIRRGDYVSDAKTNSRHGVCSLDYYRDAVEHIAKNVPAPVFFIFSDDIAWVRGNLRLDFPSVFIDHNHGNNSYCDMQLMSLCRHHIIANSSFSWWGAWLDARTDKIVIAPKRWFANDYSTVDLIPAGWLRF